MKNYYSGKGVETGPDLKVTFSEDEIKLDIPDVGISLPSGWSLKPLQHPMASFLLSFYCLLYYSTPLSILLPPTTTEPPFPFAPQLQRSHVDSYQPNWLIPCCQLQLQWMKTEVPHGKLSHHLKLIGANPPETYIEIFRNLPFPGRTIS